MITSTTDNNRIAWIDSLKGIIVILIFLGHCLYNSNLPLLNQAIYSFHVPLFFVVLGYVQKNKLEKGFVQKKIHRLLYPFLAFQILSIPVWGLSLYQNGHSVSDIILDFLYVNGTTSNNPLWFLIVLFEIYIIIFVFKIPSTGLLQKALLCIFLLIIGGIMYRYSTIKLFSFLGLNRLCLCLFFFILGTILKKIACSSNRWVFIALFVWFICMLFNGKTSLYAFNLGSYLLYMLSAISACFAFLSIAKKYHFHSAFLISASQNATLFCGLQYFLMIPFTSLMKSLGFIKNFRYNLCVAIFIILAFYFIPLLYAQIVRIIPFAKVFNGKL